ncbi:MULTISPECIES: cystatin domain-containing protein [Vibrio]|uniref:Cystatin domain-containing protein n=1 Tax=Vibrio proteolyticus NBRC 13287 TaxID=1219065 RepID=U2ZN23_VIBPR|nr:MULTISPECIES: cystatin domain-containing protein [Vibrio]NAW57655.1 2-oxoglutarate dehydrogenase [Vibrio sp. V36_P2S2PM302]NAX22920.1 2-oxoglutarate dehydrogenase [Vibrio sp. V39_P1S14PM300]NAX24797.1 2-oxoglutarate dehydrogenase [Vibrio sp. V38_P2S17PM301]NAX31921.1 2-oxoglutarate dehydrogenase [Vibrio sp. V37_P2S8PM304]GAD69181.1 hypothetical protein VPR01S_25_00260 [Vibrio proteolyticus NBRC 13287]
MNKALTTSLICLAALAGCDNQQQTESADTLPDANPMCSSEQLAGGWSAAQVDDDTRQALETVLTQMNTSAKLDTILTVRTQVVAGTNYAIDFRMDDGQIWHTIVFRSLKGEYSMTQAAQPGPLCP